MKSLVVFLYKFLGKERSNEEKDDNDCNVNVVSDRNCNRRMW